MKLGYFNEDSVNKVKEMMAETASFSEIESMDFARCQRPDGTIYGTRGQCRKGKEVGPKEEKENKAKKRKRAKEPSKISSEDREALEMFIGDLDDFSDDFLYVLDSSMSSSLKETMKELRLDSDELYEKWWDPDEGDYEPEAVNPTLAKNFRKVLNSEIGGKETDLSDNELVDLVMAVATRSIERSNDTRNNPVDVVIGNT